MALVTTNGTAQITGLSPKNRPMRHIRVTFRGDAAYPGAAGSAGATAFLLQLIKDRAVEYDLSSAIAPLPANLGQWLDGARIEAYQDLDEDVTLTEKMVFNRSTDTLILKNRADDALIGAGDKSGNTYVALIHLA